MDERRDPNKKTDDKNNNENEAKMASFTDKRFRCPFSEISRWDRMDLRPVANDELQDTMFELPEMNMDQRQMIEKLPEEGNASRLQGDNGVLWESEAFRVQMDSTTWSTSLERDARYQVSLQGGNTTPPTNVWSRRSSQTDSGQESGDATSPTTPCRSSAQTLYGRRSTRPPRPTRRWSSSRISSCGTTTTPPVRSRAWSLASTDYTRTPEPNSSSSQAGPEHDLSQSSPLSASTPPATRRWSASQKTLNSSTPLRSCSEERIDGASSRRGSRHRSTSQTPSNSTTSPPCSRRRSSSKTTPPSLRRTSSSNVGECEAASSPRRPSSPITPPPASRRRSSSSAAMRSRCSSRASEYWSGSGAAEDRAAGSSGSRSRCSSRASDYSRGSPRRKVSSLACAGLAPPPPPTLTIARITEAAASLLLPDMSICTEAIKMLFSGRYPTAWNKISHLVTTLGPAENDVSKNGHVSPCDSDVIRRILSLASSVIHTAEKLVQRQLGQVFAALCCEKYKLELLSLGSTVWELLCSLDGFHDNVKTYLLQKETQLPSFRIDYNNQYCNSNIHNGSDNNRITVYVYFGYVDLKEFLCGVIEQLSKELYNAEITASPVHNGHIHINHFVLNLSAVDNNAIAPARYQPESSGSSETLNLSSNIPDAYISMNTFCQAFPFHLIVDRHLRITQLGSGFMKNIGEDVMMTNVQFGKYFEIVRPVVHLTFSSILSRVNSMFEICCKRHSSGGGDVQRHMQLKGSVVSLPGSRLLFLGSPALADLRDLMGRGLHISDMPIHDVTRDVLLMGEQRRAQDSLKKRLFAVKCAVEAATAAVGVERARNVQLLTHVFPPKVAERLWTGCTVVPENCPAVTMLVSDIVGFTAICSKASPMQVISMLTGLYLDFDKLCGILDIYKLETIGDAYCAAAGLHRAGRLHAARAAWTALSMLATAARHTAVGGGSIRLRLGLHSGAVLAGVVGTRMPRFCLFGNNVTVAGRMEASSAEGRVHVSADTHRLLAQTSGFLFTPGPRDQAADDSLGGETFFLDGYLHPDTDSLTKAGGDHVMAAILYYKLGAVAREEGGQDGSQGSAEHLQSGEDGGQKVTNKS